MCEGRLLVRACDSQNKMEWYVATGNSLAFWGSSVPQNIYRDVIQYAILMIYMYVLGGFSFKEKRTGTEVFKMCLSAINIARKGYTPMRNKRYLIKDQNICCSKTIIT